MTSHRRTATLRRSVVSLLAVTGVTSMALSSVASASPVRSASWNAKVSFAPPPDSVDALIVRAAPRRLLEVTNGLRRLGATITRSLPLIDSVAVEVAAGHRNDVASVPGVITVVSDQLLTPMSKDSRSRGEGRNDPTTTLTRKATISTVVPTTTTPTATTPTTPTTATTTPTGAPTTDVSTTDVSTTVSTTAAPYPTTTIVADDLDDPELGLSVTEKVADFAEESADQADDAVNGSRDPGSIESIARVTGASRLWRKGITGAGVDVALIDTGVAPVVGAPTLVNGADLSLDAGAPNLRFNDGYGHGTHMAGIIAGHDPEVSDPSKARGKFVGIAPGARVINVKVAAMDGTVHTSQVVAALDWVVQNKNANGMNIRVVNLSYGSPATTNWRLDPLAWAAEIATHRGIVVVAAAGNDGPGHELASPAYSPEIIAVGATEVEIARNGRSDYAVAPYTSTGNRRRPDIYVPGGHVISLRVPGSFIDTFQATANIDGQLTRGSGTSQATAVASGLAALLVQAFPSATPGQIRALLVSSEKSNRPRRDRTGIEANVNLHMAFLLGAKKMPQASVSDPFVHCGATGATGATWCRGAGDGTNQALIDWAQAAWSGSAWTGSAWTGSAWTGSAWTGSAWTGSAWTGSAWTGSAWTGSAWTGSAWTGSAWTGSAWTGSAWTGSAWTGSAWTGSAWTGQWDG